MEGKHADVTKRLSTFFGPNMELAHMVGECYVAKIETYKYEVCPFGDAKQDTTKLGTMKALELKEPRTMVFSSGERCWNGPSRSITVTLRCGGENVLAEVEEPSRCEYAATLYTPAACDAEEVEALERELAEIEEEARAAHHERWRREKDARGKRRMALVGGAATVGLSLLASVMARRPRRHAAKSETE